MGAHPALAPGQAFIAAAVDDGSPCVHVSAVLDGTDGPKTATTRTRRGMAGYAGCGHARPGPQPASRHRLSGPLHRAGVHLALPGDRTAGFRASDARLCAGRVAGGIKILEALYRELPQSWRLP